MAKRGRPGLAYEDFEHVWRSLIEEGRATLNAALEQLGGNKSTLIKYREQFERQQAAKRLALMERLELPKKIREALAELVIEQTAELDKSYQEQRKRADQYLATIQAMEKELTAAHLHVEERQAQWERERLKLERQLAAAQARMEDMQQREQACQQICQTLREQSYQAQQTAAVAQKEVELLRDQLHKTSR